MEGRKGGRAFATYQHTSLQRNEQFVADASDGNKVLECGKPRGRCWFGQEDIDQLIGCYVSCQFPVRCQDVAGNLGKAMIMFVWFAVCINYSWH